MLVRTLQVEEERQYGEPAAGAYLENIYYTSLAYVAWFELPLPRIISITVFWIYNVVGVQSGRTEHR